MMLDTGDCDEGPLFISDIDVMLFKFRPKRDKFSYDSEKCN